MSRYQIAAAAVITLVTVAAFYKFVGTDFITSMPGSKQRCQLLKQRNTKKTLSTPQTLPWSQNSTNSFDTTVYVLPGNSIPGARLGNQLFMYASTFGIAWNNRHQPIWPAFRNVPQQHDVAKFFNIRSFVDQGDDIAKSRETRKIELQEVGACVYDNKFERLPERNVSLLGYFQSYKYFQQVEDQLRVDLTFKPDVLDMARRWLEEQTPTKWMGVKFVRVVIHVRRTDLATPNGEKIGWPSPTSDYFQRSMSYFTDCLERVQFVVLSDDPDWCRKHINSTDIVYSNGHSPVVDLAIASLCDHAIITAGTYGWWAAWFANGTTITQKNIPRNGSALAKVFSRKDYYKSDWIGL